MSNENTPVETVEQNLDDFAAELFGRKEAASVETTTEVVEDEPQESDAIDEDTQIVEDTDTLAPEEDEVEEVEEVVEDAPKPKKNRLQERIDQAVGKQREAERRADEIQRQLNEVLQKLDNTTPEAPPKKDTAAPKPTDLNEDGTEKYPLGEFDSAYISDLVEYKNEQVWKRRETEYQEAQNQRMMETARLELEGIWKSKVDSAIERYPDLKEKGEEMLPLFEGVDPEYSEYFAQTLMELEYGPDVLYYLSNNKDEAKKIINSGAKQATIALGRIEAKFAFAEEEKKQKRPKVSNAPPPPEHLNKGSDVSKPGIRGDEKDINLDDFAAALFKKKR